jgi:hypothetical protein
MNQLIQSKNFTTFIVSAAALFCFGLLPKAEAVSPPPDGGYAGGNTAEGTDALLSLSSGIWNTALGFEALNHDTTGKDNTATGVRALFSDTSGSNNTATGVYALYGNTIGWYNNAVGAFALANNTEGNYNTANGYAALYHNTTGIYNTAIGFAALFNDNGPGQNTAVGYRALFSNAGTVNNTAVGFRALSSNTFGNLNTANGSDALLTNTTGAGNTANGALALYTNTGGSGNTANGIDALQDNTTGDYNTANGDSALQLNTTGARNTAIGLDAGRNQTTGSDNVYIGVGASGVAGENNACYIASIFGQTSAAGIPVLINSSNKLGTTTSSKRFKEEIKPMDKASEALLALKPVTFRYKKEIDPHGTPQFGLVAEDVEKVNPDLVVRDAEGKVNTVRYDQVNAMLLNEFLKEHRKVEEQETTIAELKTGMETVLARLKEHDSKIQKVNAQIEVSTAAAPRLAGH